MKTFTYNIFIKTTAEKLWDALTNAEFNRQYWSGFSLLSDWKLGSPVSLISDKGDVKWKGSVLAYDPTTTLAYSFDLSVDPRFPGEPVSKVTFKCAPAGTMMMLTILHEELSEKAEANVNPGWTFVASSLKSLLETGKPLDKMW
jgi:uncharacterized protein YndB with AHSA1/START domain